MPLHSRLQNYRSSPFEPQEFDLQREDTFVREDLRRFVSVCQKPGCLSEFEEPGDEWTLGIQNDTAPILWVV